MQPVSTRISSPGRQRPFVQRAAGVDERPAVALQALHDEALAAEQADAELALKRDADADALRRREKRVLLRDQLAADLGEVDGDDLAGIRRAERDLLLLAAAVEKHRHEQRLAGQQPLAGAHQRAEEPALLLRAVAEDRFHLDAVVHVHHAAGFGDGGFVRDRARLRRTACRRRRSCSRSRASRASASPRKTQSRGETTAPIHYTGSAAPHRPAKAGLYRSRRDDCRASILPVDAESPGQGCRVIARRRSRAGGGLRHDAGPRIGTIEHPAAGQDASHSGAPSSSMARRRSCPQFQDSAQWIRETLWVETEFDSDRDGRQGPGVRGRHAAASDRDRRVEGAGDLRVVARTSPARRATGSSSGTCRQEIGASRRRARRSRRSRSEPIAKPSRPRSSPPGCRAASPSSIPTRRGPGCRRAASTVGSRSRTARAEGGHRLAQRPRERAFARSTGSEEVAASWSTGKVGHDRDVVQRHDPARRGGDRGAGTGSDHSGRAEHVLLPLLPLERPRPPSWRMAGRGHRLSLRLRQQRRSRAARALQSRSIATASSRAGRDRASGDYNDFWRERDLLTRVKNIRAAVFMAHAFNDWNVVPEHSVRIYEALKGRVPLRAYFHQGGHGGAPPLEMMNRWFTRYLYGVENGVEREPKAWIVRETAHPATAPAPPAAGEDADAGAAAHRRRRRCRMPTIPIPRREPVTFHLRAGGGRDRRLDCSTQRRTGARDARRQRRVRRRRTRGGRTLDAPPALRDAGADGAAAHLGHAADHASAWRRASRRRTCRCGWWCCRGRTGRSARPT